MKIETTVKMVLCGLLVLGMTQAGFAAQILKAGAYSAKAKALVCEGCGPLIQQTLKKIPGLESIAVDPKTRMVQFRVKKDAKIDLADLQKNLKSAAREMGMGADYQLENLKRAK